MSNTSMIISLAAIALAGAAYYHKEISPEEYRNMAARAVKACPRAKEVLKEVLEEEGRISILSKTWIENNIEKCETEAAIKDALKYTNQ